MLSQKLIMIPILIFLHWIGDYLCQGILADMKQKNWWEKQFVNAVEFKKSIYSKDYIVALITHSFIWSFIVNLPLMILCVKNPNDTVNLIVYLVSLIAHTGIHAKVDNDKANKKLINLIVDQECHFIQLFFIWSMWLVCIG